MEEQEYINLKARVNIETALYALRQVSVGGRGEVDRQELDQIIDKLAEWKQVLFRLTE